MNSAPETLHEVADSQPRRLSLDQAASILRVINAAAEAYRGAIPADRWHEPYMKAAELSAEIVAGVVFWGVERDGELVGVMGEQSVRDVKLIRHAYVRPDCQGRGIGTALLRRICGSTSQRLLIGTWAAATWAIAFYKKQGFRLVPSNQVADLLHTYWNIPERQVETSVVLELDRAQTVGAANA